MKSHSVLGVRFDAVTVDQALGVLDGFFTEKGLHLVVTPNPEICLKADSDTEYSLLLNSSDLSVADGFGILWWARSGRGFFKKLFTLFTPFLTGMLSPLPARVTGTDLMVEMCRRFSGKRIFLLGASRESNAKTHDLLVEKYRCNVVGSSIGSPSITDNEDIVGQINRSGAELLFVAYGAPTQEVWIDRNRKVLQHVRVAIGIGGAFDFLSGSKKRAPYIMQRCGLEWLFRLIIEPTRIRRILNAVFIFPSRVMRRKPSHDDDSES
jgi:N-acetylglucosaminyldiphosphoundecaprenol N-acetyl-beta-D-mannosaminyltransferase